ncbi:MAG: Asp-tRNA(Asn)/Glu-tRNA(Gln) amidotransferase subunit GatA [Phycisphaerales bacterium JB050]
MSIARDVREGSLSAVGVVDAALERVGRLNPQLNALRAVYPETARRRAQAIDERVANGERVGRLAGVPVAIKDNLCLSAAYGEGDESPLTTCGSRMLERYHSPYTATAVQRLLDEDAIVIGTANMDEFGMGSSGEHCFFGATRNPHDLERVPGGSSSGSAAAVASGMVPLALGSDTGGSIRQPSALTGIVGLKPSYGRVSRWGLVAYASSLDCVGPMAANVEDVALALDVISGSDPLDSTCSQRKPEQASETIGQDLHGLKIGVPVEARDGANDPSVDAALKRMIESLRAIGADIIDVEFRHIRQSIPAYYILAPAEASSNLARYDGVRYGHRAEVATGEGIEALMSRSRSEGFGPEVQRRILLGTHTLSSGYYDAFYHRAAKMRGVIKRDFDTLFASDPGPGCHAILMPVTTGPAFKLGEKIDDPAAMYQEDLYTVCANLAGLPAISVPVGSAEVHGARLPIGMQLIGPAFEDARLLRIAGRLEAGSKT